MARCAAFLRGINITDRRIKGEELRSVFEAMGFREVDVFGASGNVILDAGREPVDKTTVRIEQGLARAHGWEVATFMRTAGEVKAIAGAEPFDAEQMAASQGRIQVVILATRPTQRARERVLALATDDDKLAFGDRELYWLPRSGFMDSALDRNAIAKLVGSMTFRTKKTVDQIARKYFAA